MNVKNQWNIELKGDFEDAVANYHWDMALNDFAGQLLVRLQFMKQFIPNLFLG